MRKRAGPATVWQFFAGRLVWPLLILTSLAIARGLWMLGDHLLG